MDEEREQLVWTGLLSPPPRIRTSSQKKLSCLEGRYCMATEKGYKEPEMGRMKQIEENLGTTGDMLEMLRLTQGARKSDFGAFNRLWGFFKYVHICNF